MHAHVAEGLGFVDFICADAFSVTCVFYFRVKSITNLSKFLFHCNY